MSSARRLLFLAPRLAALLGTSYLLIATSRVPEECDGPNGCGGSGGNTTQVCRHQSESIAFHVTGTCGPEGDIVVASAADECAVTVQGASAVNLLPAGRFEARADTMASLVQDAWTLSGYLPETALPDAGVFVIGRDGGTNPDVGGFSVTPGSGVVGSHATPTLRTCTARPHQANSLALTCSGGGVAACEAILTWY